MLVSEVFPELHLTIGLFIHNCVLFMCMTSTENEECIWQKGEKIELCNTEVNLTDEVQWRGSFLFFLYLEFFPTGLELSVVTDTRALQGIKLEAAHEQTPAVCCPQGVQITGCALFHQCSSLSLLIHQRASKVNRNSFLLLCFLSFVILAIPCCGRTPITC